MYGFYTPVLLLYAFCVYHAYRNNAEQRWYWLILLFPLGGCLMYLFHNFSNRASLGTFMEEIKESSVSGHRIDQLKKAVDFNDSVANKMSLADAHVEAGHYAEAISLYESCLQGFMGGDPPTRIKLLYAHFMNENYAETVKLGQDLESEKLFRNSEERLAYAWSLYHGGNIAESETVFRDMDRTFTNYTQRFEYCKFLVKVERTEDARRKLSELLAEFEEMQESERRQTRPVQRDIRALYETLANPA